MFYRDLKICFSVIASSSFFLLLHRVLRDERFCFASFVPHVLVRLHFFLLLYLSIVAVVVPLRLRVLVDLGFAWSDSARDLIHLRVGLGLPVGVQVYHLLVSMGGRIILII